MIYGNHEAVKVIRDFIEEKRGGVEPKLPPSDHPIRDDIFSLVEKESVLLFYPLEDEGIKGCHLEKVVNEEIKHFVFINSNKSVQEQTWTAAHELGHVWNVDSEVNRCLGKNKVDPEAVVNRFASEVLFPLDEFQKAFRMSCVEVGIKSSSLSKSQFIRIITYLMNYFLTPYMAVIRRFVELDMISRNNELEYIRKFEENKPYYEQLLNENYFSRLGITRPAFKMGRIGDDIRELEAKGIISEDRAGKYRQLFGINEQPIQNETFVITGE